MTPQFVGTLPEGYEILSMQIIPEKVRILAPAEEGQDKEQINVMTTPIFLQSIKENTKIRCQIIAPPKAKSVHNQWPDVEVFLNVTKTEQPEKSTDIDTKENHDEEKKTKENKPDNEKRKSKPEDKIKDEKPSSKKSLVQPKKKK